MVARLLVAVSALIVFALAGCSSSSSEEGAEVAIHGNTFDPTSVTVQAGEHVRFDNHDSFAHSVTANTGAAFDKDIGGGDSVNVEFPNAGTFSYYCKYHPSMRGTVVVQ